MNRLLLLALVLGTSTLLCDTADLLATVLALLACDCMSGSASTVLVFGYTYAVVCWLSPS